MSIYVLVAFVDAEGKENLTWDNLKRWKENNWKE